MFGGAVEAGMVLDWAPWRQTLPCSHPVHPWPDQTRERCREPVAARRRSHPGMSDTNSRTVPRGHPTTRPPPSRPRPTVRGCRTSRSIIRPSAGAGRSCPRQTVIKDASTRLREVEPLPNLSTRTLAAQSRASRLDAKRLDASEFDAKRLDASEFDAAGLAHDGRGGHEPRLLIGRLDRAHPPLTMPIS